MSEYSADFVESGSAWSVTELTRHIRDLVDNDFRLAAVIVQGEISNFTLARSGHIYFTLKDSLSQIKCVMWRSSAERLRFDPEDGNEIIAIGRVSVYEAGGVYQLYVDRLEPVGYGDLALAFERLKVDLSEEGLFDPKHKKSIPALPRKIGIVTSADAAALRDILNVLKRRWPIISVLIAPTLVQGPDAPAMIVQALNWLDGRNDIDTIIIARGGGSLEDLWAFNDERVARAIFSATRPIITGIGHETDVTIADFAADLRAPTPSAAAELAVPSQVEMAGYAARLKATLSDRMLDLLERKRSKVNMLSSALTHLSPKASLDSGRQQVDWMVAQLDKAMGNFLEVRRTRVVIAEATLNSVSPKATLNRGYALVRKVDRSLVRSKDDVSTGERIWIEVARGDFEAIVDKGANDG